MRVSFSREVLGSESAILACLSCLALTLYLLTSGQYGYFRDEFYYLACGEHLDWGYVDHPPFVALMAFVTRSLLGDSLLAIRFFPAVCGALVVLLTGLMARELGGGRFAQPLAALAALISPVYLAVNHVFSMNAFDYLFWALAAYVLIRLLKTDNPKLWLLFGLVTGIGLMNKYSMGFQGFGVVVGLLLTAARRHLRSKWFWLGGLVAFVIFLPHILWQIQHGFPTREFIRNATVYKIAPVSPLSFVGAQLLEMHPFTAPIWLTGLCSLLFSADGKKYRLMGWIYVAVLALFLATRAKSYYLSPAYMMLLAAGAVAIEAFVRRSGRNWLKPASLVALTTGGLITLPYALPVLPVETFIIYQDSLGLRPQAGERHRLGKLPQMYADMFGWEEMVITVADIYHRLSPEEKTKAVIYASNYGEAGAIDFFGKRYGLPKAISGHNNYWLWGPRNPAAQIVITVGESLEDVRKTFDRVELGAVHVHPYAMPYESNLPIYVGRNPKRPLKEVWPETKHYI